MSPLKVVSPGILFKTKLKSFRPVTAQRDIWQQQTGEIKQVLVNVNSDILRKPQGIFNRSSCWNWDTWSHLWYEHKICAARMCSTF